MIGAASIHISIGVALFGTIFANRLHVELAHRLPAGTAVPKTINPAGIRHLPAAAHAAFADGVSAALHPVFLTAAAVSLNRLADEIRGSALRIEATLALGATSWEAARDLVTRSLRSGMITLVDSTKTTGVVFFPGTMVGMLLAGARPLDAVRLQLILLWALLGSVALSSVLATGLGYRGFFTPAHQLRDLEEGGS